MITRDEAFEILKKELTTDTTIKHSLAVEAAMISYAKKFGEDEQFWGLVGLLHDVDFDKYPEVHPAKAPDILGEYDVEKELVDAILSHGDTTGVPRDSNLRKTLFAVDQMASFIVAVALMRPTNFEGLAAKSVKKKMKDKAFAKAVNREQLVEGYEALGVEFSEHVDVIVSGLIEAQSKLETEGLTLLS
jgi:putative nucleotidyltransferase with HDIG domain